MPILEIKGVGVRFGGIRAVDDVSIDVAPRSIHGLIGPNGAGKTTLLNAICRIVDADQGRVVFDDRDLLAEQPQNLARLGIARTFQNLVLIDDGTVVENVKVGLHHRHPGGFVDEVARPWRRNAAERESAEQVHAVLGQLGIDEYADTVVGKLPYGLRKMTELARALTARPRLLLLDEPTAGLNDGEIEKLKSTLLTISRETALTVLTITHHIEFLLGMADQVTVLDLGRVIASGPPQEVRRDPRVIAAYLGSP